MEISDVSLTLDQIKQVEELLLVWYEYEDSYFPALGAPRISPSSRGHNSASAYDDYDETDALLDRATAEAVELCVDELTIMERAAIQVQMRNKVARVSVYRNPRIKDQLKEYRVARDKLWSKFKAKGLIKN